MADQKPAQRGSSFYEKVLIKTRTDLIHDIYPDTLLDALLEEEFIDFLTCRDIQELGLTTKKNQKIFDAVYTRGKDGYQKFKECLKKTKHDYLVNQLEENERKIGNQDIPTDRQPTTIQEIDMQNIPTEKELMNIAEQIGGEPMRVGVQLDVPATTIKQIIEDNRNSVVLQVFEVLRSWKQKKAGHATFRQLLEALKHVDVSMNINEIQAIAERSSGRMSTKQQTSSDSRPQVQNLRQRYIVPSRQSPEIIYSRHNTPLQQRLEASDDTPDAVSVQTASSAVSSITETEEQKDRDLKEDLKRELTRSPYDGRLLTLSIKYFEFIIKNRPPSDPIPGGFGKVYICSNKEKLPGLDIPVVVKEIDCKNPDKQRTVANEMIGSRTMHFAIVPLLAMAEDKEKSVTYFMSPYMENGNLCDAIKRDTKLINEQKKEVQMNRKTRMKIIYHVSSALDYLHNKVEGFRGRIIHQDVASQNIVLDRNFNARLIDFGVSRETETDHTTFTNTGMPARSGYGNTTIANKVSPRNDYCYFGTVIRELLTGKPPSEKHRTFELRQLDIERVKENIQCIWKDSDKLCEVAEKLNTLSTQYIEGAKNQEVKNYMEEKLKSYQKWDADENHDKCDMCIINKAGYGWGALLTAGNDVKEQSSARGMIEDIKQIRRVLVSKCPLVMGIPDQKVKVVAPLQAGHSKTLKPMIRKAVDCLKTFGDIHTMVIYFSGHHDKDSGFQLGNENEFMSVTELQNIMHEIAGSYRKGPTLPDCFKEKRVFVVLDCCYSPDVTFKSFEGCSVMQINSCRQDKKPKVERGEVILQSFLLKL